MNKEVQEDLWGHSTAIISAPFHFLSQEGWQQGPAPSFSVTEFWVPHTV